MTLEYEQQFIMNICPICSKQAGRYGGTNIQERKFVTLAGNPDYAICGSCGYKTKTSNLIKKNKEV